MLQQIIAILIIIFFLTRLFLQRKNKQVNRTEFLFWLGFWFLAISLIVFIKKIDVLVAGLGFSATGIDVLLYLSVAIFFYFLFRLRLKLEKMDREITKIIREIALKK